MTRTLGPPPSSLSRSAVAMAAASCSGLASTRSCNIIGVIVRHSIAL